MLVLAGDIASGSSNTMRVIKRFRKAGFENIVYVPGNHEYYGTAINEFDSKMKLKTQAVPGVHFLNPGYVEILDTVFIGCTLWTCLGYDNRAESMASRSIADFRLIDNFSPDQAVMIYENHVSYIKSIANIFSNKRKVIVTHFLPAKQCIHPRWQGEANLLNKYFANDLGNWIEYQENTTWLFGHTHDSVDVVVGETRLVSNPYGYWPHELNENFKPTIEI